MDLFSKKATLVVIFILGLLELGIRYLNSYMGHYPQKDPLLHHSLVPKAKLTTSNNEFEVTYQINSYGLRDKEYPLEKKILHRGLAISLKQAKEGKLIGPLYNAKDIIQALDKPL